MGAALRIGIIGTGRIAHRFVPEARIFEQIGVTAVCNPNVASARLFAEEFGIPNYVEKAEELAGLVDAVYIATPHQTHYSYAKEMLLLGIHVLCEKPMVFSRQQAEELFAIAKEKKLVLMEGIKTAYCPGFQALLQLIRNGRIGKVYDVEACFSRLTPTNVREMTDEEFGGSFLELGTYSMLPIMKLLGSRERSVDFHFAPSITGIDLYTKASFDYGRAAGLAKTGLGAKSEGQLIVSGNKGYIIVQAPWWLTKRIEIRYEDPNKKDVYEFPFEGQGLRYEIDAFADKIMAVESGQDAWEGIEAGVSAEESIWLADKMERFLKFRKDKNSGSKCRSSKDAEHKVRIWAHRGCSMAYPENTLEAFRAAAGIKGVTGVELDVQLTKDGQLVVIHDEKVDRTTNGSGRVCDYTLEELKKLQIQSVNETTTTIPTLEEVFETLSEVCKEERPEGRFLINIELKNSVIRYEGMEEKVLKAVAKYGLEQNIVYSSFLPASMGLIKQLCPKAETGILGMSLEQCKQDSAWTNADALHPWIGGLDMDEEELAQIKGMPVRAWNMEEPFFGQNRVLREKHLEKYAVYGVTDIITNVPEVYLETT